jgi:hypothetical protein
MDAVAKGMGDRIANGRRRRRYGAFAHAKRGLFELI